MEHVYTSSSEALFKNYCLTYPSIKQFENVLKKMYGCYNTQILSLVLGGKIQQLVYPKSITLNCLIFRRTKGHS